MKNCVPRKENEIDIYGMVLYHSYLLAHEFLIKEDFEGLKRVYTSVGGKDKMCKCGPA